MSPTHQPVLAVETLHWLAPVSGGVYADCNVGLGGHAAAILASSAPDGRLLGFDWDEDALALARRNLAVYEARTWLLRRNFIELEVTLAELAIVRIDGLLLDLGISSLQLDGRSADGSARGFSFRRCESLDMRMDRRGGRTAADLLRDLSASELADILYYYGEERQARRIARAIVEQRRQVPLDNTGQLAELVAAAIPRRFHPAKIHVATRTFQALRIAVNHELENLATILTMAPSLLRSGARFCVITFHSLEDRLVKRAFRADPRLRVLTPRPVTPSAEELRRNPRSRSAKLRVAERREETG
ncbi:MAG: 16S rRNA (cytosine(1402)-N(4))-methyltransferase RsmH [Desulfobulbaceae bacterium]|nr:MAG: 16S rRNA (cytosine(1402)-N(4))-methyltransferase RsmH [Desulfobulbaceae bacterium]